MKGKDCYNFRRDKCRGENCPEYLTCSIQWGTPPEGQKVDDYDRGEF